MDNKTDKALLIKGVKIMGLALLLMFAAPTFLHVILSNKDKPFYIILLIIAIAICALAVYLVFKGLNTIADSIFKKKKN